MSGNRIAIDDLRIYESSNSQDLTISEVNSLNGFDCGALGDSTLTVSILNLGTDTVNSFEMCYQVNSETPVCRVVNSGQLLPSTRVSYSFPDRINLSAPGSYSIKAYVNYANDSTKANDTVRTRFDNLTTPFPYKEDFDSIQNSNYVLNWQAVNLSPYSWQTNQGNTPSFSTGPAADASGLTNGIYLYTESDANSNTGMEATIENINCFNFQGIQNHVFQYYYHMYGSTIDRLYLRAYTETDTIVLDSIIGEQQTSASDAWRRSEISLDTLSNKKQVRFAFTAIRGSGDQSDIAIDRILIKDSLTSIEENAGILSSLSLYPNPANEFITLDFNRSDFNNKQVEVRIFNIQGVLMERFALRNKNIVPLEIYSNGIYILEVSMDDERIRKKFIVQK